MPSSSNDSGNRKDHWSAQAYSTAADFVPKLTTTVLSYLDPQETDSILDVGCGDGSLTARIAASIPSGKVLGIDASRSFIASAQSQHAAANCEFLLHDGTALQSCPQAGTGQWDKVFSNAAMHWILREPSTRGSFFTNIHAALKAGGRFVFEMGGAGNVGEVQAAVISALIHTGVPIAQAREVSPWFFPTVDWMSKMLKGAGFEVEKCELEYRPTKMTAEKEDGSGGFEGWFRLMCADFLDMVPEEQREEVVKEVCGVLQTIIVREEDGSQWIGNVRLRAVARKM